VHIPPPNNTGGDDAEVALFDDGSASAHLHAVMVARKDVTGRVELAPDGTVQHNAVEDSFVNTPLTPYVLGVIENRAHDYATRARRQPQHVAAAHRTRHHSRSAPTTAEVAPDV